MKDNEDAPCGKRHTDAEYETPNDEALLRQRARDRLDRRAARRRSLIALAEDHARLRHLKHLRDHLTKEKRTSADPSNSVLMEELDNAVKSMEARFSIDGIQTALRAEGLHIQDEDGPNLLLDAFTVAELALTEDEAEDAENDVTHPYYGRPHWKPPE